MLNNASVRRAVSGAVDPVARGLLRLHVSPDAVTLVGTIGTSVAALWFFPKQQWVAGVLVILLFVFSDLLDGTMARIGVECNVGIAERAERLIMAGAGALLYGLGVPYILPVTLWILLGLTWFTVGQRIMHVRRQLRIVTPESSTSEGTQ